MANTTEGIFAKHKGTILVILCAVLALALIVVSAFAYQWHGENASLKKERMTLRALADPSTISSMMSENENLQGQLHQAQSKNNDYEKLINQYEKILSENGLMPEVEEN